jgi:hypothetical protein
MDLFIEMGLPCNFECIYALEEIINAAYYGKQQHNNKFKQGSSFCPSKRACVMSPLEAHIDSAEELRLSLLLRSSMRRVSSLSA